MDAVRTAAEVKVDLAEVIGGARGSMRLSLGLLHRIERSMATMDAAAT